MPITPKTGSLFQSNSHQARRPPPTRKRRHERAAGRTEFDADIRVLRDDEVDQVDGGLVDFAIIAVLIGLLVFAVQ